MIYAVLRNFILVWFGFGLSELKKKHLFQVCLPIVPQIEKKSFLPFSTILKKDDPTTAPDSNIYTGKPLEAHLTILLF